MASEPELCSCIGCPRFGNPSTGYCFRHDPRTTDEQRHADEDDEHRIERRATTEGATTP